MALFFQQVIMLVYVYTYKGVGQMSKKAMTITRFSLETIEMKNPFDYL